MMYYMYNNKGSSNNNHNISNNKYSCDGIDDRATAAASGTSGTTGTAKKQGHAQHATTWIERAPSPDPDARRREVSMNNNIAGS